MNEWFKDWFSSELYLSVYKHRDDADAKKIIDLIRAETNLQMGSKVLDAACGAGRHANYMQSLGYDVTGFDLSKTLLRYAVEEAKVSGLAKNYLCSDIRNVPLKTKYDLIVNLFTSFGYFETDEENFRFIETAYDLLNEQGFYVLDYLNEKYVKENLVESSEKKINEQKIIEKRMISGERVIKEIIIFDKGKEIPYLESVRLYSSEYLEKKFRDIGFKIKNIFGNYDGNSFDKNISPRLIFILQK